MKPITRPLRGAELWRRWGALAEERGLRPGEPDDLHLAADAAGVSPTRLSHSEWTGDAAYFRPADCLRILDELEAIARKRRPRYSVQRIGGSVALVVDPDGLADNWTDAAAHLRAVALDVRMARLGSDSLEADVPVQRTARRWTTSVSSVNRARRYVKEAPPLAQVAPETGSKVRA